LKRGAHASLLSTTTNNPTTPTPAVLKRKRAMMKKPAGNTQEKAASKKVALKKKLVYIYPQALPLLSVLSLPSISLPFFCSLVYCFDNFFMFTQASQSS
jgi:hypothetical protein